MRAQSYNEGPRQYTEAHTRLLRYLSCESVHFLSEYPFPTGLVLPNGHPLVYTADIFLKAPRLTIEVEGIGSNSSDNREREAFFRSIGVRVIHLSNPHVMRYADEIAAMLGVMLN